jgi:hypothetical protein
LRQQSWVVGSKIEGIADVVEQLLILFLTPIQNQIDVPRLAVDLRIVDLDFVLKMICVKKPVTLYNMK